MTFLNFSVWDVSRKVEKVSKTSELRQRFFFGVVWQKISHFSKTSAAGMIGRILHPSANSTWSGGLAYHVSRIFTERYEGVGGFKKNPKICIPRLKDASLDN